MELIKIDNLSNGLYLSGPASKLPAGFMRRYKGISAFSKDSVISRDGSTLIHSLAGTPHSCIYYNSKWYIAISTVFYEQTTSIKTGLSGDRLSFSLMAPTAGVVDYLFVAGGGELFKIDTSATVTNWGIEPPGDTASVADGGSGGALDDAGVYKYRFTYLNEDTGTRSNSNEGEGEIDAQTVLLLHCDGSDASTTFTDSSASPHAMTASGDAQLDTAAYRFAPSSGLFDGNDYVYSADHADFYMASSEATIDFWFKLNSQPSAGNSFILAQQYQDASNMMRLYVYRDAGDTYTTARALIVVAGSPHFATTFETIAGINTTDWYHFAFIRGWAGQINTWALVVTRRSSFGDYYQYVSTKTSVSAAWPDLAGTFDIGGGSGIAGIDGWIDEFRVSKGIARWTGAFVPEASAYGGAEITLAGGSTSIDISDIPVSTDSQVTHVELWRTQGGGSVYFRLIALANGTTTYTDNIADSSLESTVLPTDNLVPYSYFDDCFGPWNGSMFWITRTQQGKRGRVYYSPIGRAEAVQGFIEVTSDSDGLQRIISYSGNLFAISRAGIFQIYGTNPYYSRQLPGLPGTNLPHTVKITPFGVMYESQDGVRVFNGGAQAKLIAYEQVAPVFRGRTVEGVSAFAGVIAEFARGEYIISSTSQTLALDVEKMRWRNVGVAIAAIAYDPSNDVLAAGIGSKLLNFEKEGDVDDDGTEIAFDIQTGEIEFNPPSIINLVRVDADTNGETLTAWAYPDTDDNVSQALSTVLTRRMTEVVTDCRICSKLSLRVFGSIDTAVELFGFEIYHTPCLLTLSVAGQPDIKIPSRLKSGFAYLVFEDFTGELQLTDCAYFFERLIIDLDGNSNALTATLYYANEKSLAIGSITTTLRMLNYKDINRIGNFNSLVLTGDFTTSILIRSLKIVVYPIVLNIHIDDKTIQVKGFYNSANTSPNTMTFELHDFEGYTLQQSYIFERLFYDLNTASQDITATLYLVGESSIDLGTINSSSREVSEINIQKKGRFSSLVLYGTMNTMEFYRLELTAKATKAY